MKQYIPIATGVIALSIEVAVFLALMEIPPFRKGDSDIIWGLPCFFLIVVGLAVFGFLVSVILKNNRQSGRLVDYGLALNGLSLAIPLLLMLFCILRYFFIKIP